MTAPTCTAIDDIDFLVASPRVVSGTDAARVQPAQADPPAHDAVTRLLHRRAPDSAARWAAAAPLVQRDRGILILDDSTLDKPYAEQIELVTRHWSGQHQAVVRGITRLTLRWTAGDRLLPIDDRLDEQATDGLTNNDHVRALLATAQARGFCPAYIVFDGWSARVDNRTAIRGYGWHWLTRLTSTRRVNPDGTGTRPLTDGAIRETGTRVHLHGYGVIPVFRIVPPDGGTAHGARDDLVMAEVTRLKYAEQAWGIAKEHRGLTQCGGVERAPVRAARAQRTHSGCAIRAFLRLEQHRLVTGIRWWEATTSSMRDAVRAYLAAPQYTLSSTATA